MKKNIDIKNRIIWILGVTVLWYLFIFELIAELIFNRTVYDAIGLELSDGAYFVVSLYLSTIVTLIGLIVYTAVTKRNRFVLKSILPGYKNNGIRTLMAGLLVGFVMNFFCIACALVNGDIKLYLDFALDQIPLMLFAFVCVFIQSTSEEVWCRGFVYERINVRYPLWVTAWNFTQNFLFGLPNSGLVSEVSVFTLDAATARTNLIYNSAFGVEGALPAVFADGVLGIICLVLAAKKGRLKELTMKKQQLG